MLVGIVIGALVVAGIVAILYWKLVLGIWHDS